MFHPPFFPRSTVSKTVRTSDSKQLNEKPPRKPDWLLIFMSVLFLLTLLLLWIVDIPQIMQ